MRGGFAWWEAQFEPLTSWNDGMVALAMVLAIAPTAHAKAIDVECLIGWRAQQDALARARKREAQA